MQKIILIPIICFAMAWSATAQQDPQFTQFMYNKLWYNPGYAGGTESGCITAIYRKQWMGFEGAPETQVLSFNMPLLNKRVGVGLNLVRNTIGIENRLTLDGAYAYRIPMARGTMSIGLQASVRRRAVNWADSRLRSTQPISTDGAITADAQSKYVPNFGIGAFYSNNTFFVGLSVPRLLQNNIDFSEAGSAITREVVHAYMMAGMLIKVNDKVKLQPQILLKYAARSPFDADINVTGLFNERFVAGVTYRAGGSQNSPGESVDIMLGAQLTRTVMMCLSYDITLSDLSSYSSGSIEAMLRYCFARKEGTEYINPRFF